VVNVLHGMSCPHPTRNADGIDAAALVVEGVESRGGAGAHTRELGRARQT
jgi:hypothetical protein